MSFNCAISKWDVSKVVNMGGMFMGSRSFTQKLSGSAWVNSHAFQKNIHVRGIARVNMHIEACGRGGFHPLSVREGYSDGEYQIRRSRCRDLPCVQTAAILRNPFEPVVVLLAVLGIKNVEVLGIEVRIIAGLRAWRPAKVS